MDVVNIENNIRKNANNPEWLLSVDQKVQDFALAMTPPIMLPTCINFDDQNCAPAGGWAIMTGMKISWQNGPLGRPKDAGYPRLNGAFIEGVLRACVSRLQYYQNSTFRCEENQEAINHIVSALDVLESRRNRRVEANTYGTHEGS